MMVKNTIIDQDILFPSPCGVMGVKPGANAMLLHFPSRTVSVPLRGNGCETNVSTGTLIIASLVGVSVPLRGNGFETLIRISVAGMLIGCFRPLAG